jgi:hypothetical protein
MLIFKDILRIGLQVDAFWKYVPVETALYAGAVPDAAAIAASWRRVQGNTW